MAIKAISRFLSTLAASVAFQLNYALADPGKWTEGDWAQINVYCMRTYICRPAEPMMYSGGSNLEVTPPEAIKGVCTGYDSCDICNTNPPTKPCVVTVKPK